VSLEAAEGGMVADQRGAAVRVPADAFVDAAKKAATDTVEVYVSSLDPSSTQERAAAPELVTKVDGDMQLLESLGIVQIQVSQDDELLELAASKSLELSIPVPEGSEPPASIALWRFDESKNAWLNEAKANYDAETNTYVGAVKQLALWNAARVVPATCICGVVKATSNAALEGARVEASGLSYFGSTNAQTNADGGFCIAVGKDADVEVVAYDASTGGDSKRVHSKSDDTLIPPRSTDARCDDVGTWKVTKGAE
jgi:hypothetical protein